MLGSISTGRVLRWQRDQRAVGLLEVKKELDLYRDSMSIPATSWGWPVGYAQKDFDSAKKHFENAFDATGASLGGITKLGQTVASAPPPNQFRDVGSLKAGQRCRQVYAEAIKGAQEDKRIDLVCRPTRPGQKLWLQAQQENDAKKSKFTARVGAEKLSDAIRPSKLCEPAVCEQGDEARTPS